MINQTEVRDPKTQKLLALKTRLTGHEILNHPALNKGCAFTKQERLELGLDGCLPDHIENLDEQLERIYAQYQMKDCDIEKNIFLNALHDNNEVLFYALAQKYLDQMLPIIYTPTISDAVEDFSLHLRRPRGLFMNYTQKDNMRNMIRNALSNQQLDLIIMTDGERVLGIGDQGIGGMDISIGKLMVYTLCAGINPNKVLPVVLDVGTNNQKLLEDPMYVGWRHPRITGQEYDDFIDLFIKTILEEFPNLYIHWEDFGRNNARRLLEKYRKKICTFNDDMQGTAMVALANLLSGLLISQQKLEDQKIVIFGAGTAGVGIADQIYQAMREQGVSEDQARSCFYLVDKAGLLNSKTKPEDLIYFQKPYLKSEQEIKNWLVKNSDHISLEEVIINSKATVLIGCSTLANTFTEPMIRAMATHTQDPIIMPLSNPTSHSEACPKDLIHWTNGRAIIACGSPFEPVSYQNKTIKIAQGNNAFIFPGLGLGVIASQASRVTDKMLYQAALTLGECSPARLDRTEPLLPSFKDILKISKTIALAVAKTAISEGVSKISLNNVEACIDAAVWTPRYVPLMPES